MSSHRRTPRPESATKGRPCRYVVHHKARAEERRLIRQELEAFSADLRADAEELRAMLRDEGLDDDWDYDWDFDDDWSYADIYSMLPDAWDGEPDDYADA